MTPARAFIEKRNSENEFKTTIFHLFVAAFAKVCTLRPKLNRYISGRRFYQRHKVSVGFVAKRQFSDDGEESLVFMELDGEDTLTTMQERFYQKVGKAREGNEEDSTTNAMNIVTKLPRFLLSFVMWCFRTLDYYNILPRSLIAGDPDFTTVFFTNLGSIKCKASYHHLNNWGSNSIFVAIGRMEPTPVYDREKGAFEERDMVDIAITVDERIADGYYFIRSIEMFKYLIAHPELLDAPFNEEIQYEQPAARDK